MCVHVCVCVHVTRSFVRSGKEEKNGSPVCRMVLQTSRVIVRACVCVCGGGMTTRRQSGDLFPSVCVGVLAETGSHYMVD